MHILDIGCGPGTITIDLAELVPHGQVTGLEPVPDVLVQARTRAAERGVKNVQFEVGDVHALAYPDDTFDVVHAHQVLQHLGDPVQALREMSRVTKPNGIIAIRDSDFATMTWYPEINGMAEWKDLWVRVARSNGGEPHAGRQLHAWARKAGLDPARITTTTSSWCFHAQEERDWWSNMWADRMVSSPFAQNAVSGGHATKEELARISQAWREWGADEDGWFGILQCQILCRV